MTEKWTNAFEKHRWRPDRLCEKRELLLNLYAAIEELPPAERHVVKTRFGIGTEKLSREKAGAQLPGGPKKPHTVDQYRRQALRILRAALVQMYGEPDPMGEKMSALTRASHRLRQMESDMSRGYFDWTERELLKEVTKARRAVAGQHQKVKEAEMKVERAEKAHDKEQAALRRLASSARAAEMRWEEELTKRQEKIEEHKIGVAKLVKEAELASNTGLRELRDKIIAHRENHIRATHMLMGPHRIRQLAESGGGTGDPFGPL